MLGTALRSATATGGAHMRHGIDMSLLMMSGDSRGRRLTRLNCAQASSHLRHAFRPCFSPFVQGCKRGRANGTDIVVKAVASRCKRRKARGVRWFAGTRAPEKIAQAQQNLKELRQIMVRCVYESY